MSPENKAVLMTENRTRSSKKLINSSVHKKCKVKKYKKRNNIVRTSPKLSKPNMKSMLEFSSPDNRRMESNLSQQLLNSCIYDKRITASPSFLMHKRSEAMTDSKRSYLRNFIIPSSFESSKGCENEAGNTDIYYAQSTKAKDKSYTNSIRKTEHNTPLNTRKSKMYENKFNEKLAEKKHSVCITPIGSMKSACNTVARTQRQTRYISAQRDHPDNENCAYRVYESSNHRPKKPHQTPRTGAKIYSNQTMSGRHAYQYSERKKNISISENLSAITKDSQNNLSKELSFELISPKSVLVCEIKKEESKAFGFSIFSRITNWLNKELTPFPCKCDEQDESLNCCARAGRWVRAAERSTVNQEKYFNEYSVLKESLEHTFQADHDTSIDTIAHHKFQTELVQINKDIDRTMNSHPYFGNGKEGQMHLKDLLQIIALKYSDIGYVQGMNFLVVALLNHCSPEITLFLLTILLEKYELCDVYRVDVSGLHLHNATIKTLIAQKLPELNEHFLEIGIDSQMFTTEWILDLFSHNISLNYYGKFLDSFIGDGNSDNNENKGWNYFFQVIISILSCLQKEILQKYEWDEVLVFIKNYVKDKNSTINWEKILNMAKKG